MSQTQKEFWDVSLSRPSRARKVLLTSSMPMLAVERLFKIAQRPKYFKSHGATFRQMKLAFFAVSSFGESALHRGRVRVQCATRNLLSDIRRKR